MSAIGTTVTSKATGQKATVTGFTGNKILISFDGHASIPVPLSLLDIDPYTKEEIEREMNSSVTRETNSYIKRKDSRNDIAYGKIDELGAEDKIQFYRVNDVLNTCFGTNYGAWMKATWQINENCRCWFPKLVKTLKDEPAAYGCVNVISEDWNTLISDDQKTDAEDFREIHRELRVIFAREPDNGPILFRGVYVQDEDQSEYKHYVFKRIATKIRIIGNPAYDIEMLDRVGSEGE